MLLINSSPPKQVPIPKDIDSPPKNLPLKSLKNRYVEIEKLGSGSFGTVMLAEKLFNDSDEQDDPYPRVGTLRQRRIGLSPPFGPYVALKTINKRLTRIRDYNREREIRFIFSVPSHPQLVQVHEVFVDTQTYSLRIVMEPLKQNLYQLMKSVEHFSSLTSKSITSQLLAGIRHIHRYSFFHRDIKPENILVTPTVEYYGDKSLVPTSKRMHRYMVKLADYGLSRRVDSKKRFTGYVSTRWYRAPEILLRTGFHSLPIDIWAFGTVAVEIANFSPLFPGTDELDQTLKILEIIGSPVPPSIEDLELSFCYEPLGGYWDDAGELLAKIGVVSDCFRGLHISQIVKNPELQQVIQECLVWDPAKRATVEEICGMDYFKDSTILKESECLGFNKTEAYKLQLQKLLNDPPEQQQREGDYPYQQERIYKENYYHPAVSQPRLDHEMRYYDQNVPQYNRTGYREKNNSQDEMELESDESAFFREWEYYRPILLNKVRLSNKLAIQKTED